MTDGLTDALELELGPRAALEVKKRAHQWQSPAERLGLERRTP